MRERCRIHWEHRISLKYDQWNMTFKTRPWDLEFGLRSQHTGKRGIWDSVIGLLEAVRAWLTPELHDYVKGQRSRHSNQVLHFGAAVLYNHFHLGSKRSRSMAFCISVIGFKGKFRFRQGEGEVVEDEKEKQFSIFNFNTHGANTGNAVMSKTLESSIPRAEKPAGTQTLNWEERCMLA